MLVEIIDCSGGSYWYRDQIGKEFEVSEPKVHDGLFVVDVFDTDFFIEVRDCRIVKDFADSYWVGVKSTATSYEKALRTAGDMAQATRKPHFVLKAISRVVTDDSMPNGINITDIEE